MNKEVKFEYDITEITSDSLKEKIIPYINELMGSLLGNKCENVRIYTRIRKLTDKEAEVYMTLRDIEDL